MFQVTEQLRLEIEKPLLLTPLPVAEVFPATDICAMMAILHMLTRAQEKLIRSLHTKKGRQETGLCLVEGSKSLEAAEAALQYSFGRNDTQHFDKLATTKSPQELAGVAKIPSWTEENVTARETIIVLDGVQDPGNVGAILRLCLAFNAALVLIESADTTSPKVVRSSAGTMFSVPWIRIPRAHAPERISAFDRPIFRLEKTANSSDISILADTGRLTLIAGSEGSGILLPSEGSSVVIPHDPRLESLNVGHAVAIALYVRCATSSS